MDFADLATRFEAALTPDVRHALAAELGVSVGSLLRLRVGWSATHGAHSFPMQDAAGRVTGIRLRSDSGRKWCVRGSRDGLFIPSDLPDGVLYVCEGATDCAAMLTLGLPAIGRPSCRGALRQTVAVARGRDVVIVADRDENNAGRAGAAELARVLSVYCASVRMVFPPSGIKDARAWVQAGASAADVLAAAGAVEPEKARMRHVHY